LNACSNFQGDRTALARTIFTSTESLGNVVQRVFLQLLNRPAGAAEVSGRASQLRFGNAGFAAMIGDLFTSGEFAARLGG
jgi:hypothetical protein